MLFLSVNCIFQENLCKRKLLQSLQYSVLKSILNIDLMFFCQPYSSFVTRTPRGKENEPSMIRMTPDRHDLPHPSKLRPKKRKDAMEKLQNFRNKSTFDINLHLKQLKEKCKQSKRLVCAVTLCLFSRLCWWYARGKWLVLIIGTVACVQPQRLLHKSLHFYGEYRSCTLDAG